jgi:hypothetical protein
VRAEVFAPLYQCIFFFLLYEVKRKVYTLKAAEDRTLEILLSSAVYILFYFILFYLKGTVPQSLGFWLSVF